MMVIYKIRLNYVVLERSLANINCASLLNAVIGDRWRSPFREGGISNISRVEISFSVIEGIKMWYYEG